MHVAVHSAQRAVPPVCGHTRVGLAWLASRNRDANALRLAEAGQGLEAALRLLRRCRGGREGELAAAPGGRFPAKVPSQGLPQGGSPPRCKHSLSRAIAGAPTHSSAA